MYELLGKARTVEELMNLLHDNAIDENAMITASGAECHVIIKYVEDKVVCVIFDDDDYTDEWNEEGI